MLLAISEIVFGTKFVLRSDRSSWEKCPIKRDLLLISVRAYEVGSTCTSIQASETMKCPIKRDHLLFDVTILPKHRKFSSFPGKYG